MTRQDAPRWNFELDEGRARKLEGELRDELPPGHVLEGLQVRAVAVSKVWKDTVAFIMADGRVASVHLTWRKETDPTWPWTDIFANFELLTQYEDLNFEKA